MVGATLSLWMTTLSMAIVVNVVGVVAVPLKLIGICVPVILAGLWLHPPVFTLQTMGEYCFRKIVPPEEECEQCGTDFIPCGGETLCDDWLHTIQFAVVPKMTLRIAKDECADCKGR